MTAFFDINREQNGDGRKLEEYMEWMKNTLQINGNLYIVTEEKFVPFIQEHRPSQYPTVIKVQSLQDCRYYQYYDRICEILKSDLTSSVGLAGLITGADSGTGIILLGTSGLIFGSSLTG